MPTLSKIVFSESQLPYCCGGIEIGSLEKRYRSTASWDEAIKELNEYFVKCGHGQGRMNWETDQFVYPEVVYGTYGRRVVVYNCQNAEAAMRKRMVEALKANGWKEVFKFPGNHGNYTMTMFTYIPPIKGNEKFIEKVNKESSSSTDSANGSNVAGPEGVPTSIGKEARTGSKEGGIPLAGIRGRIKTAVSRRVRANV